MRGVQRQRRGCIEAIDAERGRHYSSGLKHRDIHGLPGGSIACLCTYFPSVPVSVAAENANREME